MGNLSFVDDVKHFTLDVLDFFPPKLSKIWIHVLITVGVIGGWRLFRKHVKKSK